MAANRFASELRFNGISAADFLLTVSRFAKQWLNTCIRSFPSRIPQKSKRQVHEGNRACEVLTEDESQLGAEYAGWLDYRKGSARTAPCPRKRDGNVRIGPLF